MDLGFDNVRSVNDRAYAPEPCGKCGGAKKKEQEGVFINLTRKHRVFLCNNCYKEILLAGVDGAKEYDSKEFVKTESSHITIKKNRVSEMFTLLKETFRHFIDSGLQKSELKYRSAHSFLTHLKKNNVLEEHLDIGKEYLEKGEIENGNTKNN